MRITLALIALITAGAVTWYIMNRPTPTCSQHLFIVDESKSVPADARAEAHTAVEQNIGALNRGDAIAIMPLTSDAAVDAPGRINRVSISAERKAYDTDLKLARAEVHSILEKLKEESIARPYKYTDILGTVNIAAEEKRVGDVLNLAIISDMIHDTKDLNFMTHPALMSEESAVKFADKLMVGRENVWKGARIFLGQLRSNDLKKLTLSRRNAIRAFWLQLFRAGGAADIIFATDGPGQLGSFMRPIKSTVN